ncbi:MAG TPA: glycine zipper family protein [Methylocystis sp.]|nr:glycine zipper family protein [Methylocystis sp.]
MRLKTVIISTCVGALGLSLGACANTGPAVPQVAAMPAPGKPYGRFQRDDAYCQSQAQAAIGGQSPGQAAADAQIGTALVGTALGAAAGAAIGAASHNAGPGAAVGAGSGLLAGTAVGAGNAQAAAGAVQSRYDTVYAQCMAAKGNNVAPPPGPGYYPPPPPPPGPYYGPGPY